MRGIRVLPCVALVVIFGALNSGCAMKSLREANQRLKESNDRLISENNRLEKELAVLQEEVDGGRSRPAPAVAAKPEVVSVDPGSSDGILPAISDDSTGVTVQRTSEGIQVRIPERVFFSLGQAKLSRRGQRVLDGLGRTIKERYPGRLIRVDGHTDDIPVRKVRHIYPSNWELSTARACTVVRYLVERVGLSPERIFPAGYAYYKPAVAGTSREARRQNRRVEIVILDRRA